MAQITHIAGLEQQILQQKIHLKDHLSILAKRKWTVIIVCLLILGAAAAVSFLLTPIYKATTLIILETRPMQFLDATKAMSEQLSESEYYKTQYNLLRSRNLAYKVISDLKLHAHFAASTGRGHRAPASMPTAVASKNVSKQVAQLNGAAVAAAPANNPAMANWYLRKLEITPIPGSRLVQISVLDSSPALAAQVANAHARAFIATSIHTQHAAAQQSLDWLRKQLSEQKDKVEASQQSIYEYKKVQDNVSLEERQNIISQKLMQLSSEHTTVKAALLAKEAVYNQLQTFSIDQERLFTLPEIAKDPIIQSLRQQLMQLKVKQLEMATNYQSNHPFMRKLASSMTQVQQEIAREVQRLAQTIKAALDRAHALENAIQQVLDTQKQAALALNKQAINYDVLGREAESNQHFYDILLKQAKEISLTSAMESSNVRIVDQAEVPRTPVRPRIVVNMALAMVLGPFFGAGFAFFFNYLDNTVKSPDDVARMLGVRVLGLFPVTPSMKEHTMPRLLSETSRGSHEAMSQADPSSELSGRLYSSLQQSWQAQDGQVLVVSSAGKGEGKTTILGNYAVKLARAGFSVAMVDCDVKHPSLSTRFGMQNGAGLTESIARILSMELRAGSLSEFSLGDLFFLASVRRLNGHLTISNHAQSMFATFAKGRLLHLQDDNTPEANRLGQMLMRSGFLTAGQLEDALDRNQRTGLPLGYILLNSGYITGEQLQGRLRLQMEEHLHKVFSWKTGTFSFEPANVEVFDNVRVNFGEDYSDIIHQLDRQTGSRFADRETGALLRAVEGEPNLFLINAGAGAAPLSSPFSLAIMEKFVTALKERFDVVLIDTPPLLVAPEAESLSTLADGVLLVIKAGHLPMKQLQEAQSYLEEAKATILGVVLNQVKVDKSYYPE